MRSGTLNTTQEILSVLGKVPFRPTFFKISGQEIPYMRLEVPIAPLEPLSWLNSQTIYPKIYWENPQEKIQIAAIGSAFELDSIPSFSKPGGPRFFGGKDFYARKTTSWDDIPSCRYTLPLIELITTQDISTLAINLTQELDLEALLSGIVFESSPVQTCFEHPVGRLDSPSYPIWERNIAESLQLIAQGAMQKIVLARCSLFDFEAPLNPYQVLATQQGRSPKATLFAFEYEPGVTFIGASPETLYRREGNRLTSAAIAGTRPRGKTPEEDATLQKELLENPKELHEFQVVKDTIDSVLAPLCTSLEKTTENEVIQTATVQHLFCGFNGQLKKHVSDAELIAALHPTPAVGGLPRTKALQEIRKRENFDRGWYAGPIGWVSADAAHVLVAIRSALISGTALRLFAGTGIVPGSTAPREWEELEQKISQFVFW